MVIPRKVLFLLAVAAILTRQAGHASRQCSPASGRPVTIVSTKPLADSGSEALMAHLRMKGARFEISHGGPQRVIRYGVQLWIDGQVMERSSRQGIGLCSGDLAGLSVSSVEDGAGVHLITLILQPVEYRETSYDFKLPGPIFRGLPVLPLKLPAKLTLVEGQDSIVWGVMADTTGPGGDPSPPPGATPEELVKNARWAIVLRMALVEW